MYCIVLARGALAMEVLGQVPTLTMKFVLRNVYLRRLSLAFLKNLPKSSTSPCERILSNFLLFRKRLNRTRVWRRRMVVAFARPNVM